jgi:hypothetical protein
MAVVNVGPVPRTACPFSLPSAQQCVSIQPRCMSPQPDGRVHADDAVHVLSAARYPPHCMSCQLSLSPRIACPVSCQADDAARVLSTCQLPHCMSCQLVIPRIACPVSLSCQLPHCMSCQLCPVSSLSPRIEAVIFWVGVDICMYFDGSKSLPSKGLHA